MLWESSKNQFGRPKKKKGRQNFRKFFENPPPPPRENPRSAPGFEYISKVIVLKQFKIQIPKEYCIFLGVNGKLLVRFQAKEGIQKFTARNVTETFK